MSNNNINVILELAKRVSYLENETKRLNDNNNNLIKKINNMAKTLNTLNVGVVETMSKLKQYQLETNNKINDIIDKNKSVREENLNDVSGLYKNINSINDELSEVLISIDRLESDSSKYQELNIKIDELETHLLESNSELFDTISSLETDLDDFKEDSEEKFELVDNKLKDIDSSININFDDDLLENFNSILNNSSNLNSSQFEILDSETLIDNINDNFETVDLNEIIIDSVVEECKNNSLDDASIFIPKPKQYITISNLETFLKYKNILEFYNVEKEYTFLGAKNIFDSFEVLFFNIIKTLNNKYSVEISNFIDKDFNDILFKELPNNQSDSSNIISLKKYYYEASGIDYVGERDLYVKIPNSNLDILNAIFIIIEELDDFNCTLSLDFVFNNELTELYNNKYLLEFSTSNLINQIDEDNLEEQIDSIDSLASSISYNKSKYYPSKKQKRKLKKLLKVYGYELKVELNSITKKEIESLIRILDSKKNKTNTDYEILNRFLREINSVDSFNKEYFIKCVKDGYSIKELSDTFNISTSSVYKKKKEFGLATTQKNTKDMIDKEYFKKLIDEGHTVKQLANMFNTSESVINNLKKELGLVKNLKNLIDKREILLENIGYDEFTNTIPITLYINDNEITLEKKKWRETYFKMCDYLIGLNEKLFIEASSSLNINYPSYSYYYFSSNPKNLKKPCELQNSNYFVELNGNVSTFVTNIQSILKSMNLTEDIFHIEFIKK